MLHLSRELTAQYIQFLNLESVQYRVFVRRGKTFPRKFCHVRANHAKEIGKYSHHENFRTLDRDLKQLIVLEY